jgi:hypothetical protein
MLLTASATVLAAAAAEGDDTLSKIGIGVVTAAAGAGIAHILTKRRERATAARQRKEAQSDDDRERALTLLQEVKAFTREVGGRFGSAYVEDGTKVDWGEEEQLRAARYGRLAGKLASELEQAGHAFHEPWLRAVSSGTAQVAGRASAALAEGRPSPSANVLGAQVEDVEKSLVAFVRGDPAMNPVTSGMYWDYYEELRSSIFDEHDDRSATGFISRIWQRHVERVTSEGRRASLL